MIRKKALIFGITGQDGSYLAKHLVKKKYNVTGICRRKRFINLKKLTRKKVIALGGINYSNFKKLRFTDCYGIASISSIKSYYNGKSN